MLFVAQQTAVLAGVPDSASETMRISGGNSRLPEAMAAALGDRVRLNAPVTRVEHDAGGVRVHAGGQPIEATHLILAVPPPPLRRIAFEPALPAPVATMIRRLDLGDAVKVTREYASRFWEAEGVPGFTVTDLPFHVAWAATDSYRSAGGLLTQFITGRPARAAARLRDAQRIAHFQRQLDRVYPEGRALRTTHAATTAWVERALHRRRLRGVRPATDGVLLAARARGARAHLVRGGAHRVARRIHGERRAQWPSRGGTARRGARRRGPAPRLSAGRRTSRGTPDRRPAISMRYACAPTATSALDCQCSRRAAASGSGRSSGKKSFAPSSSITLRVPGIVSRSQ